MQEYKTEILQSNSSQSVAGLAASVSTKIGPEIQIPSPAQDCRIRNSGGGPSSLCPPCTTSFPGSPGPEVPAIKLSDAAKSLSTRLKESESRSVISNSSKPHELYSPWHSPGQNTGVGSLSLLQGIFPTQRSNSGLLHCRQILYQLSHKGSPRILEWVAYPFSRGSS